MTCRYCAFNMDASDLAELFCAQHPKARVCPHCWGCQEQEPVFPAPPSRLRQLMEDFT